MLRICCFLTTLFLVSCKTTTYYVARHAEKETNTMASDVPLSEAGKQRAVALREKLNNKVTTIYSTNYQRTRGTAQPLADAMGKTIQVYNHTDTALLGRYKGGKENVLFVGHSNTVDDVVNYFMGSKVLSDLPDSSYGDLFIIKKKSGRFSLERSRFGK